MQGGKRVGTSEPYLCCDCNKKQGCWVYCKMKVTVDLCEAFIVISSYTRIGMVDILLFCAFYLHEKIIQMVFKNKTKSLWLIFLNWEVESLWHKCVHKFCERNCSWYIGNYKGECGMNAWKIRWHFNLFEIFVCFVTKMWN